MDIDYHFDMIKVLAFKAGFSIDDAQTIAYACQYVDDANEYTEMLFDNIGSIMRAVPETTAIKLNHGSLYAGGKFNRACTGHDDLQSAGGALVAGQLKTYVPYHFVPTDKKGVRSFHGKTDYRMSPNSPIVRDLINQAVADCKRHLGDGGVERQRVLIRLGIALHTFIDSWAHKDFSGFHMPEFNSVTEMWAFKRNGDTHRLDHDKAFASSMVPPTGHAGVHRYPDCSHMHFGWTNPKLNIKYEHNNPVMYLEAAEKAYIHLVDARGGANQWDSIKNKVQLVTEYYPDCGEEWTDPLHQRVLDAKKKKYVEIFPECELVTPDGKNAYNKLAWKRDAYQAFDILTKKEMPLDSSTLNVTSGAGNALYNAALAGTIGTDLVLYHYKNTDEARKWVLFHLEAWRHRDYVISQFDMPTVVTQSTFDDIGDYAGAAGKAVGTLIDKAVQWAWPVAQELEKKGAWISVNVVNATPFRLEYVGADRGDFDISVQRVGSADLWLFETPPVRQPVGFGKYWPGKTPTGCSPGHMMNFAACETDNALSVMTGVALFRLTGPHGACNFSLGFTRPANSSQRKLGCVFDHNREHVYNETTKDEYKEINVASTTYGNGSLRVIIYPNERAKVHLAFITDLGRHHREEQSYYRRNPDVASNPDYRSGGKWGDGGAFVHYAIHGRDELLKGRDSRYWAL